MEFQFTQVHVKMYSVLYKYIYVFRLYIIFYYSLLIQER